MEIIKTTGLTKTYQNNTLKVEAVKQVDLSISEGEFTAIVGPSGSGKTTLFNMIGGLDDITAGAVLCVSHNAIHTTLVKTRIGSLPRVIPNHSNKHILHGQIYRKGS